MYHVNYNLYMTIIHAIILGVVEGLTEFLPISSTAHLILTSRILNIAQSNFVKSFEVIIQSGAILAVVIIYFRYVLENRSVIRQVLFSFLPTAVIGFALYKIIKLVFFETDYLIIGAILIIGILFLILEWLVKRKKILLAKTIETINLPTAIFIGLAQAIAVLPGVSRAGIVISVMMLMGYKRDEAARYSFLLAVPTILAASVMDIFQMRNTISTNTDSLLLLAVGFIVSFVVAYAVIKWFIGFLRHNSLVVFGVYRIILAIILVFASVA